MSRLPVVADRFYPGDPGVLKRTVAELVPDVLLRDKQDAFAIISPHAGYVYSGAVAGETVAHVNVPDTVLILGPNHHGKGAALAMGMETWTMPMGDVPIDQNLAEAILQRSSIITHDETAHAYEHSLEVQVPFLQFFQANLHIVPIVVSHVSYETCVRVANNLAAAIKSVDKPVLMVASTDMTHYESRQSAGVKDHLALDRIQALDPQGLYETVLGNQISMCGIIPTTITLLTALELGAVKAEIIRYTDSGEASGDIDQVVGYAGLVIS